MVELQLLSKRMGWELGCGLQDGCQLSKSQQCPFITDEIMLSYIRRSIGKRLK